NTSRASSRTVANSPMATYASSSLKKTSMVQSAKQSCFATSAVYSCPYQAFPTSIKQHESKRPMKPSSHCCNGLSGKGVTLAISPGLRLHQLYSARRMRLLDFAKTTLPAQCAVYSKPARFTWRITAGRPGQRQGYERGPGEAVPEMGYRCRPEAGRLRR